MKATTAPASREDAGIKWAHRTIPLSYAKHVCGRVAWTPEPQSIAVESELESQVLAFLIQEGHLIAVHSQPFTLSFVDGGARRAYTPDFLVVYHRLSARLKRWGFGPWTVIEVKPASFVDGNAQDIHLRLKAVEQLLGLAAVCLIDAHLPTGRA